MGNQYEDFVWCISASVVRGTADSEVEGEMKGHWEFIFATIMCTLLVLGILSIVGYIVYFGYKMLSNNPVIGCVIMISPLIFIICAFQVGEYF